MMAVQQLSLIGGRPVYFQNASVSTVVITPATATATIEVRSDGTVVAGGTTFRWLHDGLASQYEVRATLSAGTAPTSGTLGVKQALSSTRIWSNLRNTVGVLDSTILLEIYRIGGADVLASGLVSLIVEVDSGT